MDLQPVPGYSPPPPMYTSLPSSSSPPPTNIKVESEKGHDTFLNIIRVIVIVLIVAAVVGILEAMSHALKSPGLRNLSDIVNKTTGAAAYALDHWEYFAAAGVLLLIISKNGKWMATKMSDCLKSIRKGTDPTISDKVADASAAAIVVDKTAEEISSKGSGTPDSRLSETLNKATESYHEITESDEKVKSETEKTLTENGVNTPEVAVVKANLPWNMVPKIMQVNQFQSNSQLFHAVKQDFHSNTTSSSSSSSLSSLSKKQTYQQHRLRNKDKQKNTNNVNSHSNSLTPIHNPAWGPGENYWIVHNTLS